MTLRPTAMPRAACSLPRDEARPRRHRSLVGGALAVALFASTMLVSALPATAASSASPIMFGAAGSTRSMIETNESLAGRKVVGARVYRQWDQSLFSANQTWARDTGHTLFLSVKAQKNGAGVRYSSIANAQPGSALYVDMQRQARDIKAFGDKVYITFQHEPEAGEAASLGSGAEFAAAWRKVVSVYRAEGVRNAQYVWTVTAYGFARKDDRRADLYYPGDPYVDHIAADGYNWYRCRDAGAAWRPLADVIEAHRQFGLKHPTKGLMLLEFGSAEDAAQPGRKAAWLKDGTALFQRPEYSQYKAVLTWEGRNHDGNLNCAFDFNSSASARDAWKAWNAHPAFSQTDI